MWEIYPLVRTTAYSSVLVDKVDSLAMSEDLSASPIIGVPMGKSQGRTADLSWKKRPDSPLIRTLFSILFLVVIASSSPISPGTLGDILALMLYVILTISCVLYLGTQLEVERYVVYAIFIIMGIYIINIIRLSLFDMKVAGETIAYGSLDLAMALGSAFAYLVAISLHIVLLPQMVRKITFFKIVSVISAVSIILGIPMIFVGEYSILGIGFIPYTHLQPFREMGIQIYAVNSYFSDANDLSRMAFFGVFSSLFIYLKDMNRSYFVLLLVNLIGLFLGNSRGTIAATLLGLGFFYLTNKRLNERLGLALLIFSMPLGVLLIWITDISLAGRGTVWQATIMTTIQNPFLGTGLGMTAEKISPFVTQERWIGLGTQNTYLFVFLTSGFIGGISYLYLVLKSAWKFAEVASSSQDRLLLSFGCSLIFLQWFEDMPVFGINKVSLITGLLFGFLIYEAKVRSL